MTMNHEGRILIAILLVSAISLLERGVNNRKWQRINQFPLIFLALAATWIGTAICTNNMDAIAQWCADNNFWENSTLLIGNAAILLCYSILRMIGLPLLRMIGKRSILQVFAGGLFRYDEDFSRWVLRTKWTNLRGYTLAICWGITIASGIYLGVTWVIGSESDMWMTLYPCIAVATVNELYNYMNGQTCEEIKHSVMGNDADARHMGSFYRVREILENIMPEPLLSAHSGCEYMGVETPADLIWEMRKSDDPIDRIVAEYFEKNDRYKTANIDFFQATVRLMHRDNVVVFHPFYRDLEMYLTLPLISTVLKGKKCLVLCGDKVLTRDVEQWLCTLLSSYTHVDSLCRVNVLSKAGSECEVGIMTFTQIYDNDVIRANSEFLHETDLVLMLEPSAMLSTSQVALQIILEEIRSNEDEKPVYCVLDRYTDGIVDTLSHLIRDEITNVVAMPVPRGNYTAMFWNADGDYQRQRLFDRQTRYLGNGVELAAIAIKNQIPKVKWYSQTKLPVRDVRWIASQYYATICRYMNLPSQQKKFYEKLEFVSDLWGNSAEKEQFAIVEDEFCNMFSTMRAFLSRGTSQVFVNVLSENYLLRDYMRCNPQMFISNPNAIPCFVPDYAKTERNTLLKLLMLMVLRPVSDAEIRHELDLIGIETEDVLGTLSALLRKYTYAEENILTVHTEALYLNEYTENFVSRFSINKEIFSRYFASSLRNAYYVVEEEESQDDYLDARLFDHVAQTVLPGQYVTYNGKYYRVKYVSPQSGVILRRASDKFDERRYYRQLRSYTLDTADGEVVSIKRVGDVDFCIKRLDFHVDTTGYLEMNDAHDLRTARLVDLSMDSNIMTCTRRYHNKSVLIIHLPEANDHLRFTICMLLSEIFRTVFPNGWPYLAVMSRRPADIEGMLNYMVYPICGEEIDDSIYVVEDSTIDLGLLDAIEKNFSRLMEILADYLEWHFEKMHEPPEKDPVLPHIIQAEQAERKRRSKLLQMFRRIRRLFAGRKDEQIDVEDNGITPGEQTADNAQGEEAVSTETTVQEAGDYVIDQEPEVDKEAVVAPVTAEKEGYDLEQEEQDAAQNTAEENAEKNTSELAEDVSEDPDDGTDIFEANNLPEDEEQERYFVEMGLKPLSTYTRYQRECFLKFGFNEIDKRIQVEELLKYLRVRGWSNNVYTRARKREVMEHTPLDSQAVDCCDFCGMPLSGISYDRLNDGRIRCNNCSASAISDMKSFSELFYLTIRFMEDFYKIQYKVPIRITAADARTVAKGAGMIFRPSKEFASRTLGYAMLKHGEYSIVMENGSPRLAAISTMVHELTHIWQYRNWSDRQIEAIYGMNCDAGTERARLIVYEGMAMWASIQYLYQIGESYYAQQQEEIAMNRNDVYGIGFRLYCEQYPLIKDFSLLRYSPFTYFPTIEPTKVKEIVKAVCDKKPCIC